MDTIVVGAGIAGITAARLLHAAGQCVVVPEAREGVGGRIWTGRRGGVLRRRWSLMDPRSHR
ncbi:hypothetical protein C3489_08555 [Streptomyces sp. Ru71]|uniref:FAD-dependent oxidoreductase n=1 Tax=Streptomyces sp. Ru71 TaxID=2080746 RepID=UPI000CDD7460|nr:FAD-dependent oxidoreductase [Streptomyces sp. Ru71]POX55892.1 hypothetical protein C3489_08555 [Streptomyces sp. Ru71]